MKTTRLGIFVFVLLSILVSCGKEFSETPGIEATGSLKDSTGDCLPFEIKGTFAEGKALSDSNYIQLDVDVSNPGSYKISTDTVNGISFAAEGIFLVKGVNTIELKGSGTPVSSTTTILHISYNNFSCEISLFVGSAGESKTLKNFGWEFYEDTAFYHGSIDTVSKSIYDRSTVIYIYGKADQATYALFGMNIEFVGQDAINPGIYPQSNSFSQRGTFIAWFDSRSTIWGTEYPSLTIEVTTYDRSSGIVSGRFSGTTNYNSVDKHTSITKGRFKLRMP